MRKRPEGRRAKLAHVLHLDGAGGGPKTIINHISYYCNYYDLTVYHGDKGKTARACDALGITHFKIPLEKLHKIPFGFISLFLHLRKTKPDLLYLHGQWAGPVGAIAGKLAGVPRIMYMCHWPAFYTDWDLFRVIRNHIAEWIPCYFSDRVMTLSEGNYYQYLYRGLVKEKNLVMIPNSLDPKEIPAPVRGQILRDKFAWSPEHVHVVSVGRLADQKRMDWLFKSWIQVQEAASEARLWIVGGGEDEEKLRAMAIDLGLGKSCTFLGSQPDGINFIAAADIVVMTTIYEGHANIPLEAMCCGKPIIASSVDGVKESYTDGEEGYLVPPAEIDIMADRIIKLVKDKELRAVMGVKGMERVKVYDKTLILRRYLNVIEEVLAEH